MINLKRASNYRCIMQKNVNSSDIITSYLNVLSKQKSGIDQNAALNQLKYDNIYIGRSTSGCINTLGVRLSQMCFYMFGYKAGNVFMPSPMTANLLNPVKHISDAESMLVTLFSIQFPSPYSKTNKNFHIRFGRLFIKLLLDNRIEQKLYIDEILWFLPFIESINNSKYEILINSINEYRKLDYTSKLNLFNSIPNNDFLGTLFHEFNYYFLRIFPGFNVLKNYGDSAHNNGNLLVFQHPGSSSTKRSDAYKKGAKYSGYVTLDNNIVKTAKKLSEKFSAYDEPITINEEMGIQTKNDLLTALYETEPLQYLTTISKSFDEHAKLSEIVSKMIHASKYGSRDGKEFENALEPFMQQFDETADVTIWSGSGHTDLHCIIMDSLRKPNCYGVNIDAKTRHASLETVTASRINKHMSETRADYCIIIAPRFAPGVSDDIATHKIVTVKADVLGSYCYHECLNKPAHLADYHSIDNIIRSKYGQDITEDVRNLTISRYGIVTKM